MEMHQNIQKCTQKHIENVLKHIKTCQKEYWKTHKNAHRKYNEKIRKYVKKNDGKHTKTHTENIQKAYQNRWKCIKT